MAYNHGYYAAPPLQAAPVYPAYGAPVHHQPAYAAYAPPPPVVAPPPPPSEAFRHFFRSHLATLTFNSRPVINHLTQLALDQTANFENASIVSDEIAKGIFEVRSAFDLIGRSRHVCARGGREKDFIFIACWALCLLTYAMRRVRSLCEYWRLLARSFPAMHACRPSGEACVLLLTLPCP